MERDDDRYNGWTNYETWAVALWLDNDEQSYRYWRRQVAWRRRDEGDNQRVRADLAEQLKREVVDAAPLDECSLYADLLNAAFSEVDWYEIVEHWMNE